MQRNEAISQDPRYEAKLTPVRLRGHNNIRVTPRRKHLTPGNVTDTMRSPVVGRVDKVTWSRKKVTKNVKVFGMKEMENDREICLENGSIPLQSLFLIRTFFTRTSNLTFCQIIEQFQVSNCLLFEKDPFSI